MAAPRDIRYHTPSANEIASPRYGSSAHELTLYVKHIPKHMTEEDLKHLFTPYGVILKMRLEVKDMYPTNRAYVEMKSKKECEDAIGALHGWTDGLGNIIYVEFKKPPRLGANNRLRESESNQNVNVNKPVGDKVYVGGPGRGKTLLSAAGISPNSIPPRGQYQSPRFSRPYGRGMHGSTRGGAPDYRGSFRGNFRGDYRGWSRGNFRGGMRGRGGYYGSQFSPRHGYQERVGYEDYNNSVEPPPLQKIGKCLFCSTTSNLRCSSCKVAAYCSRGCQTKHWNQSHKNECNFLRDQALNKADKVNNVSVDASPDTGTTVTVESINKSLSRSGNRDSDTESVTSSFSDNPGLPINQPMQVKLSDFISPSQFFVQLTDEVSIPSKLPRVWECSLHGVVPSEGAIKWNDKVMEICSASGLALGGLCTISNFGRKNGVYQTKLILRNGTVLSERLVSAGLAALESVPKYKVKESLHTKLEAGQTIHVVIDESSVKSISDFYVQVGGKSVLEELRKFSEMEPKLRNFAGHIANKPHAGYKPDSCRAEVGDFVIAPFEDGWYRGNVTDCNEKVAAVAFIDYGNIDAMEHQQLVPLPRQFTDVPAIATHCKLHGYNEAQTIEGKALAVSQIKALAGDRVKAVVRSVTEDGLSVDLFTEEGVNVADALVKYGYVMEIASDSKQQVDSQLDDIPPLVPLSDSDTSLGDIPPLEDDSSSKSADDKSLEYKPEPGNNESTTTSASNRTIFYEKNQASDVIQLNQKTLVLVVNVADLDTIYVQTADKACLDKWLKVMDTVSDHLSANPPPPLETLHQGELLLAVEPQSGEWDRVVILDHSPDRSGLVRVRSIDYGSEYQVQKHMIAEINDKAAKLPMRAISVTLAGVSGKLGAQGHEWLQSLFQKRVFVTLNTENNRIVCEMCSEDGESINQVLASLVLSNGSSSGHRGQGDADRLDSHGRGQGDADRLETNGSGVSIGGSPNMPPLITTQPSEVEFGSRESRQSMLEEQIMALQTEKQLLTKEIMNLKQRPLRGSGKSKTVREDEDDEFTL